MPLPQGGSALQRPVLSGEALRWPGHLGTGMGHEFKDPVPVAWFLLLCSSEEGRLRSPIPGASINSEVWPLGWSPGR